MALTKLYRNCEELPLRIFFKIIQKGDLRYLVREWREGEEFKHEFDLSMVWDSILDEYQKISGDTQMMRADEIRNQIYFLESLKSEIESCILYLNIQLQLSKEPDEEILKILKVKTGIKSVMELEKARKKAISYEQRIKSLSIGLKDETKDVKPITFDDIMAELYDYGYQVQDNISLSRFLAIKKRINGSRKKPDSERRGDKSSTGISR